MAFTWTTQGAVKISGVVLGAIAALMVAGFLILQLPPVQRALIAGGVNDAIGPRGVTAHVHGTGGLWPWQARVARVSLADAEGTFLVLEDLDVRLSPLALVSGKVSISRLAIGGGTYTRQPQLAQTESRPFRLPDISGALTSAPSIEVKRFELAGLEVALSDDAVTVRGEGGIRLGDLGLESALRFEAGDAGEARIDTLIDAHTRTISIDMIAADPRGRWLAPLLALAPGTPIDAAFHAEGPEDAVVLNARAAWGPASFQMNGTVHWLETLSLTMTGDITDALGGDMQALAGARQDFDIDAEIAEDGAVHLVRLRASSPTFAATAEGTIADTMAIDGALTVVDASATALALGLDDMAGTEFTFQVSGPRDRPVLSLNGTAERFSISDWILRDAQMNVTSHWLPGGQAANTSLAVTVDDVSREGLSPALAGQRANLTAEFTANLADDRVEVAALAGTWGPLLLHGSGDVSREGPMRFDGTLGARELGALDPRLSGEGRLAWTLERARATEGAPLEIEVRSETQAFGAAGDLAAIIGPTPRVHVVAALSETLVDVETATIELTAGELDLSGEVDRASETLALAGTFATRDLAALHTDAAGPLSGALNIGGSFDAPQVDVTAESSALSFRNVELHDVTAALSELETQGTLTVRARGNDTPLALDYDYERAREDISGELTLVAAGLDVRGPLGVAGRAPQGNLTISAEDIGPLVTLVRGFGGTVDELRAHGGLSGELVLEGWSGHVSLAIDGAALEGVNAPTGARRMALDTSFDLAGAPSIEGRLTVDDAQFGPSRFSVIDAKARGPLTELAASLSLRGPANDPFHLYTEALRREAGAGSEITLTSVEGRSLDFEVEFAEGGTLIVGPQGTELLPTTFAVRNLATGREGVLSADARLWAGAPYAHLSAEEVPAGSLAVFGLPVDWTGILDGVITLDARGDAAPLRVAMMARQLTNDPELAPLDARLTIDASGSDVEAQLYLTDTADGAPLVAARSTMPLVWQTGRFAPRVDWDAPLEGTLRANAPLRRLWPFVPVDSLSVAGILRADVTLAGTLGTPLAHGRADLAGGALEHFQSGFILREANGSLTFDEAGELTADIQGTDGNGGTAHLTATAMLPQSSQWAIDGSLRLHQLMVARRDELSAQASGNLRLAGTLAEARLEGDVTMDRIDAQVPNQLPPSVVDLPVVRVNDDGTVEEIGPANGATRTLNIPIDLDVQVNIPRRAFVRGRGLDSEWAGALALGGRMNRPRLDGTISIVRGTFDFSRTRFDLTDGAIEFRGGDRINPQVRLQGEAQGPEFTSIIRASGSARAPRFTIASDPVMPQETVMAQILFGKRPEELSAFELVQIGEATASLTGSGGFDFLGSARRATGLDVLSIGAAETSDGTQDVNVTVGRYVAPNVFVGARRGFEPGSGAVTVEMEVTPQVTVDAEVRQDAEGSVGVDWRWDY